MGHIERPQAWFLLDISTAQESMLQAPPVTAGGVGQASRQERRMKAGLSLNSEACLAGQTGAQRPSCVSSWLGYWAAALPARRILGPWLCPRHFSPGDRYLEASVPDSGQDPLSIEKGNSKGT